MEALPVTATVVLPASDLAVSFARSGGPGGQNVNKVETRVELRFALETTTALAEPVRARLRGLAGHRLTKSGELLIASQRFRSQGRNLDDCRERLRELVLRALEPPPKPRRPTRPSRGSVERRLREKSARAQRKQSRGRVRGADD